MGISTGDIVRVASRMLWNAATDIINVWMIEILDDNANSLSDILTDLGDYIEAIMTNWITAIPNNVTFADLSFKNMSNGETYGTTPWPNFTATAVATDATPPSLGAFAYMRTDKPHVQARKWIAPLNEVELQDGQWSSAILSAIANGLDYLVSGYAGSNFTSMIARIPHLIHKGLVLDPPQFLDFDNIVVSSIPGIQRRRRK